MVPLTSLVAGSLLSRHCSGIARLAVYGITVLVTSVIDGRGKRHELGGLGGAELDAVEALRVLLLDKLGGVVAGAESNQ